MIVAFPGEAPLAQCVKRWHADLAVQGWFPLEAEIFKRKRGSGNTAFISLSSGINIVLKYFFFTLGRTHGAPYRGYGYIPLRFGEGGGGTSLGEWEHNNTTKIFFTHPLSWSL